jgi:hypothetical protein
LVALGPALPAGTLSAEQERIPDDCASQLIYKDVPDSRIMRAIDAKINGGGGMRYQICFDDKDRMKGGLRFILIQH